MGISTVRDRRLWFLTTVDCYLANPIFLYRPNGTIRSVDSAVLAQEAGRIGFFFYREAGEARGKTLISRCDRKMICLLHPFPSLSCTSLQLRLQAAQQLHPKPSGCCPKPAKGQLAESGDGKSQFPSMDPPFFSTSTARNSFRSLTPAKVTLEGRRTRLASYDRRWCAP